MKSSKRKAAESKTRASAAFAPWVGPALLGWAAIVYFFYLPREAGAIEHLPDYLGAFTEGHLFNAYMAKVVFSLGITAWITWLAWETGRLLLGSFFSQDHFYEVESWALQEGVGLGLFCVAVFLLGLAHAWDKRLFLEIMATASVLAVVARFRKPTSVTPRDETPTVPWRPVWIIFLGILFGFYLLGEACPEIFYDSLYYHIAVPSLYRMAHRIISVPTLLFSNFVMMAQMIFGLAVTVGTTLSAKFLHGVCAAGIVLTFLAFEKRFLSRGAGWMASLIFLSMPFVGMNAITAGTDVAWSFFQLIAVFAFVRALLAPSDRWWILAGGLAGVSAACKYPALPYLPLALGLLLWKRRWDDQAPWRIVGREAAAFTIASSVAVGCILFRNVLFHHNPLYPFGGVQWGIPKITPRDWHTFISDANTRVLSNDFSSVPQVIRYVLHPWFMTMEGRSNGDYVGPLLLIFLPLIFLRRSPSPAWRQLRRYAGCLWLLWMLTTTTPRYGLPALALAALLMGDALASGFGATRWRPWIFGTLLVGVLTNSASFISIVYAYGGWAVVGGLQSEADYLSDAHAGYPTPPYEGIAWMNDHLPEGSKILFIGEARSYYCRHPFIPSSVPDPQPLVMFSKDASTPEAMAQAMRQQGITHLFLNFAEAVRTESYGLFTWDSKSWPVFDAFWKRNVRLDWKSESGDRRNPKALYVYELLSEAEAAQPHAAPPDPFERWRPR